MLCRNLEAVVISLVERASGCSSVVVVPTLEAKTVTAVIVEALRPVPESCAYDHPRQRQGVCRSSEGSSPVAGRVLLRRPVQFLAAGLQRAFERPGAAILPEGEYRFYESDAGGSERGREKVEPSTEKRLGWNSSTKAFHGYKQALELTGLQGVALTF